MAKRGHLRSVGKKETPKPTRRWEELKVSIDCPACGMHLGRCHDDDTRRAALDTHQRSHCLMRED